MAALYAARMAANKKPGGEAGLSKGSAKPSGLVNYGFVPEVKASLFILNVRTFLVLAVATLRMSLSLTTCEPQYGEAIGKV